jgi:hypothetical protein
LSANKKPNYYYYDWHFVDRTDMVDWMNSPIDVTLNAWKCKMLDKVKSHLSLLDREVELSKMTAQFDQLGTEVPLALCICNEVIKNELQQVTAKLSELGSALGPDPGPFRVPGPFVHVHGHDQCPAWLVMLATFVLFGLFVFFMDYGIPYIVRGFFYDQCPLPLMDPDRWEEYWCKTLFDVPTQVECHAILFSHISGVMSYIKRGFAMMYVYIMTVPSDPVDNVDMNGEVLADLSDVSVWTFISELNHCAMIVAHNIIMSVFE